MECATSSLSLQILLLPLLRLCWISAAKPVMMWTVTSDGHGASRPAGELGREDADEPAEHDVAQDHFNGQV